jgi:hypothetical protein
MGLLGLELDRSAAEEDVAMEFLFFPFDNSPRRMTLMMFLKWLRLSFLESVLS